VHPTNEGHALAEKARALLANKAEDWKNSVDWVPTAGLFLFGIQTYESYRINIAHAADLAAKNAAAKVPNAK
jgi:hypothetical protein